MGQPHGTFIWTDIALPDPAAGKAFYENLFGWSSVDNPIPDGGAYTMFHNGEDPVAGLSGQSPGMAGMPAMWYSYVKVDDVDSTTSRASQLSGTVIMEPMDVMDAGRMAVIQDPTGGVVCLWQSGEHDGAGAFNVPSTMTWNELATRDAGSACGFYCDLLGWETEKLDMEGVEYHLIKNGGRDNGGIIAMDENWPAEVPAHWMVYFAVEDIDGAVARLTELGGSLSVPPTDIAPGRFAVVADPQGGTFSFFQGNAQ